MCHLRVLSNTLLFWIGVLVAFLNYQSVFADPIVQGYNLVSTTRVGRTTFDYVYRPLVRNDGNSYRGVSFNVTSSVPSTQVIDGKVEIGDLDAGKVLLSKDSFTIRQDRLVAFNPNDLKFQFSGQINSKATDNSNITIGQLLFLENGGRPGHEGSFPIQASEPPAGKQLGLRAELFGDIASANYQLTNTQGSMLSEGALINLPVAQNSPIYLTSLDIPNEPFRISISITGKNSDTFHWESSLYSPTLSTIRLEPTKSILKKGESIPLTLRLNSNETRSTAYSVKLWLPNGFQSVNQGPWSLMLTAGETKDISTTIKAPAVGAKFSSYTLFVEATPLVEGLPALSSSLDFEVE